MSSNVKKKGYRMKEETENHNQRDRSRPVFFEPFLSDRLNNFKPSFAIIDTTFNDSTISPIKLSIPKNRISFENQNQKTKPQKPKIYDVENNNRLLNIKSDVVGSKDSEVNTKYKTRDGSKEEYTECTTAERPQYSGPENKQKPDESMIYDIQTEEDHENPNPIPNISYENTNLLPKNIQITEKNLFEPIPIGSIAVFYIFTDPKNPVFITSMEEPEKEICKITRDGKIGSFSYIISTSSNPNVATVISNFSKNAFYSTANIDGHLNEISAVSFKKKNKAIKIRQFEAFLPLLNSDVIITENCSLLLKEETKKFVMGPRPPKIKCGIPVLYFGGRIKKESTKNFILETHDDSCAHLIFGKASDNSFVGEIHPPLSPIQAITIALAHFK